MRDPFKIDGPTCLSFSGGRSSAYMLWRTLQANSGLPAEALVCFANTGKEHEATLRFVRDCAERWGVSITWVEYRVDGYAEVDFETASRDGEPFEACAMKRKYLPNPVTRFCTVELKIRTMHKHLKALGWHEGDGWEQWIGIRADEPRRVAKIRARPSPETTRETMVMPLADAGVSVQDVGTFWAAQDFDLALPNINGRTLHGNCDLCFLKPANQVFSLIREEPRRAEWWAKMETMIQSDGKYRGNGARFRQDRPSYADMHAFALDQGDLFNEEGEGAACFCGD